MRASNDKLTPTKPMELIEMEKISRVNEEVKLREWSKKIQECKSSGLTVAQWCANNNLNIKTYYYRLRKVRESLCEIKERQEIVAVNFLEEEKSDSKITIKASGLFVEIPSDISAITLQTIIEALRC